MANIWRDPIFDRTSYDVNFALMKIAEWKKQHTHSADIAVEEDKIIINEGTAKVDDVAVLETEGATYVEDDVLVMELGCVYDLKGCLNLSDLTRIEDNITYLSNRLTQYMYHVATSNKEWVRGSLPTALDMKRIADNIRSLFNGFLTPDNSDIIPNAMLSYEDINALEHNLYLLKQMLDTMEGAFIKSGTNKCGTTNRLPIRR